MLQDYKGFLLRCVRLCTSILSFQNTWVKSLELTLANFINLPAAEVDSVLP